MTQENLGQGEPPGQGGARVGGSVDFGFGGYEDRRADTIQSLDGVEEKEEGDMIEGVELLCLFVSSIQYLAAREPIPRSQYLFNYHICIKEN